MLNSKHNAIIRLKLVITYPTFAPIYFQIDSRFAEGQGMIVREADIDFV
jgi:hypothetical protein